MTKKNNIICLHGEVSRWKCKKCVAEYRRKYKQANKDKIRKIKNKYKERNRDKILKQRKEYYQNNKEKYKQYAKENKDKVNQTKRNWAERNKDKVRQINREYCKNNRNSMNHRCRNRRARLLGNGGTFTYKEWEALKNKYNYVCLSCGKKEPEIILEADHVIPLSKGGINSIENIQPLCVRCNRVKYTRDTDYRK